MLEKNLKFRLWLIFLILPLIILTSCGGIFRSSEIKESDVDVNEIMNVTEEETQHRNLNNCEGKVEYSQTISQEQSVNKLTNVSFGGKFGAGGLRIIEAAIEAKYESTKSEGRTSGDTIELSAPPGTNVDFTITWVWIVYSGNIIINGEPDTLDYTHRQLVEVRTLPKNLGCVDSGIELIPTEPVTIESTTPPDSPDIDEFVSQYLADAIQIEITAKSSMDASLAESMFTGEPLENIRDRIEELRDAGFYEVLEFDFDNSYYDDIRRVNETTIEVDTCENWSGSFYRVTDNMFVELQERRLFPQTITIKYFGNSWYISNVVFYEPPSFCQAQDR